VEGEVKSADEEIAVKVAAKLQENDRWSKRVVDKVVSFVKEGNVSSDDIIFLLENSKDESNEDES
jgi:hypothetical protein